MERGHLAQRGDAPSETRAPEGSTLHAPKARVRYRAGLGPVMPARVPLTATETLSPHRQTDERNFGPNKCPLPLLGWVVGSPRGNRPHAQTHLLKGFRATTAAPTRRLSLPPDPLPLAHPPQGKADYCRQ